MLASARAHQFGTSVVWGFDKALCVRVCSVSAVASKSKARGGWSRLLRDFLRLQLFDPAAGLTTTGVPVEIGGGNVATIFAELHWLLSDGDGHRLALQWMGAGCLKPCFRHWNVMMKHSNRAHHVEGYVEIGCADPTAFSKWKQVELLEAIDVAVAAHVAHGRGEVPWVRVQEVRKAFGFSPTAQGLLPCPLLRTRVDWIGVLRYDWVHTFLADGVLNVEMWNLIDLCDREGYGAQADLHAFLRLNWVVPAHRRRGGRQLWRIFSDRAAASNSEAGAVKCSSSELLSLYGMMRHWAHERLPRDSDAIRPQLDCFLLACDAVDVLMQAKRCEKPMRRAGEELRDVLVRHQVAHQALHGLGHVKPKHHWAFDIAEQLQTDAWLFDSFVIERLHLRIRTIAEHCKNLASYETSVLSGVFNDHARRAEATVTTVGLLGRTAPLPGWPGVIVSDHLEISGMRAAVGDFVFRGRDELAEIAACAADGGELFIIADEWQKVADVTPMSARWQQSGDRVVWRADQITECLTWQMELGGTVLAIRK